jgi:hypothetical protein
MSRNQAVEIDKRKLKLEASFLPEIKKIFKNMAKDAQNLYESNNLNPRELAENYYNEFVKDIRDMMRRSVKVFGYDLREILQKKGIDFNLLLTKELFGLDVKLKIDQEGLKPKVNKVNIDFQKEMTLFIANESEKQARYITETNAKEIELAIRQEQLKISKAFSKEERAIIARNIFINLLDRKDERADLIASQVIGMTESYSRFKEAEIIHDAEIESNGIIIGATKTWWAILDMKTRPEHVSADQQMISIKDSFLVAGESLKMPRDPNGSAGNTINCRCVANYDLQETKSFKAISDIDLKPTEEMAKEAERGLKWREEFGRGGTAVGVARANQLKNRENLTPRTIGRMVSFFARHEVDKQAEGFYEGEEGFPSAGRVAHQLWGADVGKSWANRKWAEIKKERDNKNFS